MKLRAAYWWLTATPAALLTGLAMAAEPPPLRHNPFSRPPSVVLRAEAAPEFGDDIPLSVLELKATMVSSGDRLANVGGRILRPGDEFQGYRLLQVYENRAVFARDDDRLTLFVKPNLEVRDE